MQNAKLQKTKIENRKLKIAWLFLLFAIVTSACLLDLVNILWDFEFRCRLLHLQQTAVYYCSIISYHIIYLLMKTEKLELFL